MTESELPGDARPAPSRTKIIVGSVAALAIAAAALVFFVLPAELGIDPTGAGESSGLNQLSATPEMTETERGALREGAVLTLSDATILPDRWEYELAPFEMIEFKYTMAEGAPMIFNWSASGPLEYDLHAHPFEGGEEMTESYAMGEASEMKGSYIAPFTGIHGWFWQNRTMDDITLVLTADGGFTTSTIFGEGAPSPRAIEGGTDGGDALPADHSMQQPGA